MEVTSSFGIFGRLGQAMKGILVGLVLAAVSVVLLVFNERNAVKDIQANKEIDQAVTSIGADEVKAGNEGKLVHLSGRAETDEVVENEQFGIRENAIRLSWDSEIYQWSEKSETTTKKKLGGGEERVTTYSYEKIWSRESIDSSNFQEEAGHENPAARQFRSGQAEAARVTVGAFRLPAGLIAKITSSEPYELTEVPAALQTESARVENGVYFTGDPSNPAIGDERVSFSVTRPGEVSVMAVQSGETFAPYRTKSGKTRFLLYEGELNADQIVQREEQKAKVLRWGLRILGFILMSTGFGLILKPLSVLADVVPLFGNLVGAVTGFIAMMFAVALSFLIIAASWIAFRPLVGIPLVIVALVALFFGGKALFSKKNRVAGPVSA